MSENTSELPLHDLTNFYRHFAKRDRLEHGDLDARLELPVLSAFFRIHRTEYAIRVIGQELPPNRYNFFFLSLVRTGSATKTDGMNTYQIQPHTLWSTPLGQIHSAKDWTADATGYYVAISPDFLALDSTLLRLVQTLPFFRFEGQHHLYLSEAESDELYGIFNQIEQEFEQPADGQRDALIRLYLTEILLKAERLFARLVNNTLHPKGPSRQLTDRYKQAVDQNFRSNRSLPFYGEMLAVHPNYLSNTIKAETGQTAGDLLRDRVIQEAKYLLYQSDFSVKEIAYYLSFEDTSYFSKYFKKATGQTPQAYQAKVRE